MSDTYIITVYTENNILAFDIVCPVANAEEVISEALESDDTLILTTTEGSTLILNSLNVIAFDLRKSPPSQKSE